MAKEQPKHTDISDAPELLRLAEEVLRTQQAQVLVKEGEELVTVSPVEAKLKRHAPAGPHDIWADYDPKRVRQGLKDSAGALAGVDRDELLRDIYAQREQDSRGRPA